MMKRHPRRGQKADVFAPLKSDLGLRGGKGGAFTHTRASTTLTVDSDGYYRSVAIDQPAYDVNGLRVTPQLTNKCQCYGLIPDDEEQAALTSGTMTVGKVYKIKVQSSTTDFVADGAPNPHAVGDTFVCTAATVTLTAGKSVAEMKWAVGTKSFHNGSVFILNIEGIILGGSSGCVLKIVNATTKIASGKLQHIVTNGKAYNITSGATESYCFAPGDSGNTNTHSLQCIAYGNGILQGSGSGVGGGTTISGDEFTKFRKTGTPGATNVRLQINATPGSNDVFFILPGLYENTMSPLYPVVANSTGGSTTRAQTTASIPLAPNFRQASFMVTLHSTPDFALANIPNSTAVAIATLTSGTAANLLYFYKDGSGNGFLQATDGSNTATVAWTPVAGTTYKVGVRGNTALNQLQVCLNGTNGTATNYDGGIAADGQNKLYIQGIASGMSHKNIKISADRGAAALAAATA